VQKQKPNGAANQRRDSLHKASAKLAAANRLIVVGNMAAVVYNPLIEQGAAFSHGIATDLDYTGLLGLAFISKCGHVFATPTVTIPTAQGQTITISLTPAQTLALPACGHSAAELESYDYLVELYDPADVTRVYRMVNGVARVSPRKAP
jgi:hypothetical protein